MPIYNYPYPAARRVASTRAVCLAATLVASLVLASSACADFGIRDFSTQLSTAQAGATVNMRTEFDINTTVIDEATGQPATDGSFKDVHVELPAGLIGNTTATPRCTSAQLISVAGCAPETQIGVMTVKLLFGFVPFPAKQNIYNMVPDRGSTAELAALFFWGPVHLKVRVRDDGDFGLSTDLHDAVDVLPLSGSIVDLWGNPADTSHDAERGPCLQTFWDPSDLCPTTAARRAFLRNPSTCGTPGPATLALRSWRHPEITDSASAPLELDADGDGNAEGNVIFTGCDQLPSPAPESSIKPEDTTAAAPAAYDIGLDIPQAAEPDAPATPPLQTVTVDLPNGTAISPGSADGLGACTDAQLHQHDRSAVECPDASKIGSVSITTPYLADPLEGSMFLGEPKPGDQFRLFMVAEGSGVSVRLIGSAVPDPQTGRLRATFDNLPPIAFSHLHVHMKGGPRAVLVNPSSCGTATSTTTVTPYGGGVPASDTSSFDVTGDCSAPSFTPTLAAGTTNPVAGADSPFVLQIRREDGQQDLKSVAVDLPAGLIGKVAGLPLCPTAAAVAGTCSDASKVGSVSVAVGTGSNPISLPGSVYMTEGYGGPFGLVFVVPAKIGPFDFGTVVVRAKVQVDPTTGALHVQTGDMPSIIAGIPLHYRAVTVTLDRAGFMRNPTSCAEQQITASLTSASGTVATPSTRFQVAGCGDLKLAPKTKMTFNGAKERKRNGRPGFSFLMSQTPGQSNLRSVAVTLPGDVGVSLALPNPCTIAQFETRSCPAASRVGFSSVTTPLLDDHLEGGVYLVAGAKAQLPRLGVLLDGQVPISLLSTVTIAHGHLTTTFAAPDLPISTFKLSLNQKSVLTAAKNLCGSKQRVVVAILGASGARKRVTQTVPVQGCSAAKHKPSRS